MAHLDGHCAIDGETIYVKNTPGCVTAGTSAGSSTQPFCYPVNAISAVTSVKRLILVRGSTATDVINLVGTGVSPISVVGQENATINTAPSAPGITIPSGVNAYIRDLSVVGTTASNVGIQADSTAVLRLQKVRVLNNGKGGILLNGASFDLNDVVVSGNGPGIDGAVTWGGIYVKALPTGTSAKAGLNLVSVLNNKAPGITCVASIPVSTTVYASANSTTDISTTCGVTPCSGAIPGVCGASIAP